MAKYKKAWAPSSNCKRTQTVHRRAVCQSRRFAVLFLVVIHRYLPYLNPAAPFQLTAMPYRLSRKLQTRLRARFQTLQKKFNAATAPAQQHFKQPYDRQESE